MTGARGSGHISPRNSTGRLFAEGIKRKRLDDEARERERRALAASAGGAGTDLGEISEQHGGADVYTDPSTGVVVVDYSGR